MFQASVPIGIAQAGDAIVLNLPRHFWLVVSLHRSFRGVTAEPDAWTYRVPGPGAALKVERWIAEVELRLRAEGRRRAWTASDAEWLGVTAPAPAVAPVIGPAFAFTLPSKGVAKATLRLLARMAAGEVLVASYAPGEGRTFAMGGRVVRASVVDRALEGGFVVPTGDSLFGPEFSQTWRLAPEAPAP